MHTAMALYLEPLPGVEPGSSLYESDALPLSQSGPCYYGHTDVKELERVEELASSSPAWKTGASLLMLHAHMMLMGHDTGIDPAFPRSQRDALPLDEPWHSNTSHD